MSDILSQFPLITSMLSRLQKMENHQLTIYNNLIRRSQESWVLRIEREKLNELFSFSIFLSRSCTGVDIKLVWSHLGEKIFTKKMYFSPDFDEKTVQIECWESHLIELYLCDTCHHSEVNCQQKTSQITPSELIKYVQNVFGIWALLQFYE